MTVGLLGISRIVLVFGLTGWAALASSEQARPSGAAVFHGTCDASGAIPLNNRQFMVADDEDNVLRVYDAYLGGEPVAVFDLAEKLTRKIRLDEFEYTGSPNLKKELDLEAATRIGDVSYWLTSHGRNARGKRSDERFQLLALRHDEQYDRIELLGQPYERLLDDLAAHPAYKDLRLEEAAKHPAESAYGINIEGMTARNDGAVFIGFRNPAPQGRALIVVLRNPQEVVMGGTADFGEVFRLDLGGLGVRGLSSWNGIYIIAAGDRADGEASSLYVWLGDHRPAVQLAAPLPADFNTEAFFTSPDGEAFMALSDDGGRLVNGRACKRLKDPQLKSFRGVWLSVELLQSKEVR